MKKNSPNLDYSIPLSFLLTAKGKRNLTNEERYFLAWVNPENSLGEQPIDFPVELGGNSIIALW